MSGHQAPISASSAAPGAHLGLRCHARRRAGAAPDTRHQAPTPDTRAPVKPTRPRPSILKGDAAQMRQRRFVAVGSKAYQKQRQAPAGPGRQTGDSGPAVTPGEVIRFVVCVALIFFGMIGVPTIVAKLVHRGAMPDVTAWLHTADAKRTVRVYQTSSDTTTSMALNDYVLDVLAAEFSPGAPMASLKAAAVATRTYAIHAMISGAPGASLRNTMQMSRMIRGSISPCPHNQTLKRSTPVSRSSFFRSCRRRWRRRTG